MAKIHDNLQNTAQAVWKIVLKTIPHPYLHRVCSVSSPYLYRRTWYGAGTELIRSKYGVDTEQVHLIVYSA